MVIPRRGWGGGGGGGVPRICSSTHFPRFTGEFPSIYKSISDALRNQYSIAYQPSNQAKDGKFRKLKVELVDPANGNPLRITDDKGKPMKYSIVAKQGYTAPREVE